MSEETKLFYADLGVLLDTGYYTKIIDEINAVDAPSNNQLIYKAKALRLQGNNKEALDLLNSLQNKSDLLLTVQSLRERAHILMEMGYYDTAQNMMNECFEILAIIKSEGIEIKNIRADVLHTSGNLLSFKGDFQNALNFWEESLGIKKSLGKILDQAVMQNNIAIYYAVIEEYDKALGFFYEALGSIKPFEISKSFNGILFNIGDTYFHLGNLEKAIHFVHRSLDLTSDSSMDYIKVNCLSSLINYYLIAGDTENANKYYKELQEIADNNKSVFIQLLEKYVKALILKSSSNRDDHQRAKSLFQQFLNPSALDYQLFTNVVLNLADLLVQEVYETENSELIEDLIGLIELLYEDAQEKQLFHYMIEALILKSKVFMLSYDFKKSKFLLDQAEIIAEDNQFAVLKTKIKTAQSHLKVKKAICEVSNLTNFSLREQMDICGLRSYIESQLTNKI